MQVRMFDLFIEGGSRHYGGGRVVAIIPGEMTRKGSNDLHEWSGFFRTQNGDAFYGTMYGSAKCPYSNTGTNE